MTTNIPRTTDPYRVRASLSRLGSAGDGRRRPRRRLSIRNLVVDIIVLFFFLIPLGYVVMIALKTNQNFLQSPLTLPGQLNFDNFAIAWTQGGLGLQLANTVLYSGVSAAVTTAVSLFIAFPISRKLIKGAGRFRSFIVLGLFLPLAIIPLFVESQWLNLYNNRLGYIVLHVEETIPLGVVLIAAAVAGVPRELDEAAFVDGCGYLRYVVRIIAPLVAPSLFITFMYSFLRVWNDIIGPVVYLNDPTLFPVARGLFQFYGGNVGQWPVLAAAICIVSLPVVVLFLFAQRYITGGDMSGGVKM